MKRVVKSTVMLLFVSLIFGFTLGVTPLNQADADTNDDYIVNSTKNGVDNGMGFIRLREKADGCVFTIIELFETPSTFRVDGYKILGYYRISLTGAAISAPYDVTVAVDDILDTDTGFKVLYLRGNLTLSVEAKQIDGKINASLLHLGEIVIVANKVDDNSQDFTGGLPDSTGTTSKPLGPPWWIWPALVLLVLLIIAAVIFIAQTKGRITVPFLQAIKFTVSFETYGGEDMEDAVYGIGELMIALDVPPVREGYEFCGWYKDSSLNKPFKLKYMPSHNLKLYAKWEEV